MNSSYSSSGLSKKIVDTLLLLKIWRGSRGVGDQLILTAVAVFAVLLWLNGLYFSTFVSTAVLAGGTLYLARLTVQGRLELLVALKCLIFMLPFIHIPPYLFFDYNDPPILLWGLRSNPYMVDEKVVAVTAEIGAIAMLGLCTGASLTSSDSLGRVCGRYRTPEDQVPFRTLRFSSWLILLLLGVLLAIGAAPRETIFAAQYTEVQSFFQKANFTSALFVALIIMSFAFVDAIVEANKTLSRAKTLIASVGAIYVVVFLQFLRGDRESISWVFGLFIAKMLHEKHSGIDIPIRVQIIRLFPVVALLVAASILVGAVRSGLSGASLTDAYVLIADLLSSDAGALSNVLHGTWSASLLTPLSVAGDYIYGSTQLKYGKDYLDLLLSIVPGFVADAINYQRPIDALHGPAWEMRYGIGGTHATVLPFRNFGILGVFFISALSTAAIALLARRVQSAFNVSAVALGVAVTTVLPHWLWYGEKALINTIVVWLVVSIIYNIILVIENRSELSEK